MKIGETLSVRVDATNKGRVSHVSALELMVSGNIHDWPQRKSPTSPVNAVDANVDVSG